MSYWLGWLKHQWKYNQRYPYPSFWEEPSYTFWYYQLRPKWLRIFLRIAKKPRNIRHDFSGW